MATCDAWTSFVIDFLCEKQSRRGQRQKNYSDTFGTILRSTTIQLAGSVRQLAKYWPLEKLKVDTTSSSAKLRKQLVLDKSRSITGISFYLALTTNFLDRKEHRFNTFLSRSLEDIHDCYVAELADDSKSILRLGSEILWSSFPPAVIDHLSE